MKEQLKQLHEVLVKPVLASRKYLNADKLVDAMLEVGLAVNQAAAPSHVLVKLTDMAVEFNKLSDAKPDWCKTNLDGPAVSAAFAAAVKAARPVIVPAKPNRPGKEPTPPEELRAKCVRKKGAE